MDEPQDMMLSEISQTKKKDKNCMIYLHEIPRISKLIKKQVTRDWWLVKWGVTI